MFSYWRMAFIFGPALMRGEVGSLSLYIPFVFGFVCRGTGKEVMRLTKIVSEDKESKKKPWRLDKTLTPLAQLLAFIGFICYFEAETKNLPNFFFSSFVSPMLRHYFPLYGDHMVYTLIATGLTFAWFWQGIDSLFLGFLFLQGIPEIQRHLWMRPQMHTFVVIFFVAISLPYASIGFMAWYFPAWLETLPAWYLKGLCYMANALPSVNDYYEVLGLARGATKEEIGSTYRKLARQYHPDKLPKDMSQPDRDAATDHFTKIAEANDMLSRPERRAEYDDLLQNPEMKELIPRSVACLIMMGYWLIHLIIDVNDFENQRDENKNRLRTHILNGQPLNYVALGITDPEQLRDYCRNEDCDLPMLAKNDINDVTAFRELLKESGFALEKMPEEMEADPLTQLIPQTKAAEVKSGLQAPNNVVPNSKYGPGGAKTDAKRIRTKMAQQKGYVRRVKQGSGGGCSVM